MIYFQVLRLPSFQIHSVCFPAYVFLPRFGNLPFFLHFDFLCSFFQSLSLPFGFIVLLLNFAHFSLIMRVVKSLYLPAISGLPWTTKHVTQTKNRCLVLAYFPLTRHLELRQKNRMEIIDAVAPSTPHQVTVSLKIVKILCS